MKRLYLCCEEAPPRGAADLARKNEARRTVRVPVWGGGGDCNHVEELVVFLF